MATFTFTLPSDNTLIIQQIANPDWIAPNGFYFVANPAQPSSSSGQPGTAYKQFQYSYQLSIQNASGIVTNITVPEYIENVYYDQLTNHLIIVSVPSLTSITSETSFLGPSQNGPLYKTTSPPQLISIYDYDISGGQLTPVLVDQAAQANVGLLQAPPLIYVNTTTISGEIDPDASPAIFVGNEDYTQSETPIVYSQPFKYTIGGTTIFTTGNDEVNFGALTPTQVSAIKAGADFYHTLGGSDTVTLPNLVDGAYVLSPTVNIAWNPSQTFVVGALTDTSANTDTVTGGNGNYDIDIFGPATANITITGDGSSTISTGSGTDTIVLNGPSTVTVKGGATSNTLLISGSGGASVLLSSLTSSIVLLASSASDVIENVSVTDDTVMVSQGYVVGDLGQATMSVGSGATVTTDYLSIGNGSGATGTLNVDGAGTTLTALDPDFQDFAGIGIGNHGQGTLVATNDAQVNAGTAISMGVFDGASGNLKAAGDATVKTANLNIGGSEDLGAGGIATVIASTGGAILATSLVRLFTGTIDTTGGGSVDIGSAVNAVGGAVHIGSSGSLLQLKGVGTINGQVVLDPSPGADIEVNGGTLIINGDVSGGGNIQIDAGSTLELNIGDTSGAAIGSGSITFDVTGTNETLQIDGKTMPTNVIKGFGPGNTIDLRDVPFNSQIATVLQTSNNLVQPNNVLYINDNGTPYKLQLDQNQAISGGFAVSSDGKGGTAIKAVSTTVLGDTAINATLDYSTSVYPYSAVCFVTNSNGGAGTGFIIGPHSILTAAHVVESTSGKRFNVFVYPGSSGPSGPFIAVGPPTIYPNPDFVKFFPSSGPARYDWAVVNVSANLAQYGMFQILPDYSGGTVNITGYEGPGNFQNNQIGQVQSVTAPDGTGSLLENPIIQSNGDSGGPLWIYNGSVAEAVGVVSGPTGDVLLTSKDYSDIQNFMKSTGKVAEGYLAGATVFADANNNGVLDPSDVSTTTDATGNFNLTGGSGPLIAFGGTDISTGLPFKGQLAAPQNSTVITPLTTLLKDLSSDPLAEANILAALGLPAGLDLTTFDPIAAAQGGDAGGAATYVAGAKVYDTASLIASALAGVGGDFGRGVQNAFSAIATALDGGGISLNDQIALSALISNIAIAESLVLGPGVADGIAAIIADSNAGLDQKLQTDSAGTQLLADVAAGEFVAQGPASDLAEQAAADASELPFVIDAFTGSNLANAVNASLNALSNGGSPAVIAVFASPSSADLNAGKTVEITLTVSEAVIVSGDPTLALNDNGSASYVAAKSTPTTLVFDYTVRSGENTSALAITGASLNGGTIQNSAGTAADLSGAPTTFADIQIDTSPPTIAINPIATDDVINATESGQDLQITGTTTDAEDDQPVFVVLNGVTYTGHVLSNAWSITVPKAAVQQLADESTYTVTADVSDRAGNPAPEASRSLRVDTDQAVTAAASLEVNDTTDHVINAAEAKAVSFTVSGLDDETGRVSFSDGTNSVSVPVSGNGAFVADLSGLNDGPITSTLSVSDPEGNSFTEAGNTVALDTDKDVSPLVSFIGPVVDAAADKAWPINVSGLDDETGKLTFTDAAGRSISISISGNGLFLAILSSLSDGAITSVLSVSDPVGNQWSISGGPLTAVGAPLPASTSIQLLPSTVGNLGKVGGNGPTVIDATQTHGITFQSGNGPDTIAAGPNDNVYAGNGPHTLVGAIGATLHAGSGPQTLYGAPGETVVGGTGQDTFAFEPGFGQDTVANFHTSNGVLQFNPALLANFAAAMADTKQVGANTVITLDTNDSVTLQNINMNTLTANNFHFA